jgi:probable phosphoglycerate mutase
MLTLHLLRHGDTTQSAEGYLAGDIDPPLDDRGLAMAEAVARVAPGLHLRALHVSPKLRARQTAEPVARACGLVPFVEPGLREIAYGAWDGRKESELLLSDPVAFEAWRAEPDLVPPPGGESAYDIAARALPVVQRVRRQNDGGSVLLVSHKATIRVIVCALLGVPVGRFRERIACPTASLTTFELSERGAMLVRLGDVGHLT